MEKREKEMANKIRNGKLQERALWSRLDNGQKRPKKSQGRGAQGMERPNCGEKSHLEKRKCTEKRESGKEKDEIGASIPPNWPLRMGVVPPAAPLLSWSSARLLALLLNSLSGFLDHLEKEQKEHTMAGRVGNGSTERTAGEWDTLLGMRLIQDHLFALDRQFRDRGYHPAIFQAIRNLSAQNDGLLEEGIRRARKSDPEMFGQLSPIITGRMRRNFEGHKLVDESLRWAEKEQKDRNAGQEAGTRIREEIWMDRSWTEFRCLCQVLSPSSSASSPASPNCAISSADCAGLFSVHGQVGPALARQLLFFLLISDHCSSPSPSSSPNITSSPILSDPSVFLAERCANIWDELNVPMQRNRKQLNRLRADTLALLLEQVFLCGHRGFVQFANPHLLLIALSWQHPELGCWTAQKPDPVPNMGMNMAMEFERMRGGGGPREDGGMGKTDEMRRSREEDLCLPHLSIVAALALCSVYLRFLLDPGPWPEHAVADQLVQMDGVLADDKFRQFAYLQWVRSGDIGLRQLRPPPSSWSPDLIAFICLLFLVVLGFVLFVQFCGDEPPSGGGARRGGLHKKMYPYAFKKL